MNVLLSFSEIKEMKLRRSMSKAALSAASSQLSSVNEC